MDQHLFKVQSYDFWELETDNLVPSCKILFIFNYRKIGKGKILTILGKLKRQEGSWSIITKCTSDLSKQTEYKVIL